MAKVRYKKPPIVEAVFECFFDLSPHWNQEANATILNSVSPNSRKTVEELAYGVLNIDMKNGLPPVATAGTTVPRIRCWNEDRSRLIQYGPNMVAVNVIGRYSSIEDYVPDLVALYDSVSTVLQFQTAKWAGQRFINQIDAAPGIQPDNIFTLYPTLPPQVRAAHPSFALQVETLRDADKTIAVNLEYRGLAASANRYVLDIYLRSLETTPISGKNLASWMLSSHQSALETFEASFTELGKVPFERLP